MTIRYLLCLDPSRRNTVQLGDAVPADDPPRHAYSSEVEVDGQTYIMADVCFGRMVPHPTIPDAHSIVSELFLARPEEWPYFEPSR